MSREAQIQDLIAQVRDAFEERENFRLGVEVRHLKAVGIFLLAAVAVSVFFYLQSRPHVESIKTQPPVSQVTPEIVVDVAGKVARPGVYRFADGARAIDAIQAAGGALPGVSTQDINLAHVLADGEQILVGAATQSQTSLIDINIAGVDELDRLPGVGPVLAQRIVGWRQTHGRFGSVEAIKQVPGVGAATFAELKNLIRV